MFSFLENINCLGGVSLSQKKNPEDWQVYAETVDRFIQVIAKNMTLYGVTPSIGRLYGVLYFSDSPMTLNDMRDTLEMSKTSMSTGVRTLAEMNMIEPTYEKGERKHLYQSEEDWYQSFTSLFGNLWRQHTEKNIEQARVAIERHEKLQKLTCEDELKSKIITDIEKFHYAKNYYKWLMEFIDVIESGKIFDYIPKIDE